MANVVPEGKRRIQKPVSLSPEAWAYLDEKAPLFARGGTGGRSKALEAMVFFARDYEVEKAKREAV